MFTFKFGNFYPKTISIDVFQTAESPRPQKEKSKESTNSPAFKRYENETNALTTASSSQSPSPHVFPARVKQVFDNGEQTVVQLTFEDEQTLICTPEHRFYVLGKGWKTAVDLKCGDKCISASGKERAFVSRIQLPEKMHVYNFEVEKAHTYFAGNSDGILVHNMCSNSSNSSNSDSSAFKLPIPSSQVAEIVRMRLILQLQNASQKELRQLEKGSDLYYLAIFVNFDELRLPGGEVQAGHAWLGTFHIARDCNDFYQTSIIEQKYRGFGPGKFYMGANIDEHQDKIWDAVLWLPVTKQEYDRLQERMDINPWNRDYRLYGRNCVDWVFKTIEDSAVERFTHHTYGNKTIKDIYYGYNTGSQPSVSNQDQTTSVGSNGLIISLPTSFLPTFERILQLSPQDVNVIIHNRN